MNRTIQIVCVVILAGFSTQAFASETRQYLLGDIDGFVYEGVGSEDDVYVNPILLAHLQSVAPSEPNDDFDVLNDNNNVPFTFQFDIPDGEQVISAYLTIGLRATASLVTNDWIVFYTSDIQTDYVCEFPDLGWLPIGFTGTHIRTLDLSDVLGSNYLPLLQDGELNIVITDDTAVDYALLDLVVTPEPATLSLLALGGLAMLRRRRIC